jgi:hypothetical protein
MYENLQAINLTKFLNKCCGSANWVKESWLVSLDSFVGTLSEENKKKLKSKINNNLSHYQTNDIVNEIMVACAFHPKAHFVKEDGRKSYDLFDNSSGLKIEVKTLNEGDDEKERHKQDKFLGISRSLTNTEIQNKKIKITEIIRKKCLDHLTKALCQIDNSGKIYLIYDYNLLISENIGTKKKAVYKNYHPSNFPKKEAEKIIQNCLDDFSKCHLKVFIEAIYFGDLREKVANFKISIL